ncbi:MAG: class I SAM-dependent methyltransferase, partial [Clostridia bacterium]|nr:class I SAM-dependent methyltransferase [Clostridia bacterium]
IGTDQSVGMLMEAQRKVMESGKKILLLNQSMEELDLYGTIDSCISTLDCINHLESHQNVKKAFQMVSLFMVSGGVFAFDVNTIYKHHSVLANNAFVFENDKVFCTWQNTLNDDDSVDINLDFFEQEDGVYYRESESFTERAYTFDDLTSWLEEAGFTVKAIYKDMTTEPAIEKDERAVFLAVKR